MNNIFTESVFSSDFPCDSAVVLYAQDENSEVPHQRAGLRSLCPRHATGGIFLSLMLCFTVDPGRKVWTPTGFPESRRVHLKHASKATGSTNLSPETPPEEISVSQEWANLVEPIHYRSTTPMGEVTVPTTETVCHLVAELGGHQQQQKLQRPSPVQLRFGLFHEGLD